MRARLVASDTSLELFTSHGTRHTTLGLGSGEGELRLYHEADATDGQKHAVEIVSIGGSVFIEGDLVVESGIRVQSPDSETEHVVITPRKVGVVSEGKRQTYLNSYSLRMEKDGHLAMSCGLVNDKGDIALQFTRNSNLGMQLYWSANDKTGSPTSLNLFDNTGRQRVQLFVHNYGDKSSCSFRMHRRNKPGFHYFEVTPEDLPSPNFPLYVARE